MEENQNQNTFAERESAGSGVSFPSVNEPKKQGGGKAFLVIGTLILVAILGFVVFKSAGNKEIEVTDQPSLEGVSGETETVATSTPSATPTPKAVSKKSVSVEVQNGTGITGEAAYLQNQLKNLGYGNVETGNATTQTATATKVTFLKSLPQEIVDEITKKLNEIYKTVDASTSSSGSTDVVIVTGLRKNSTPLPSATATPRTTPTPTATPQ